MLAYKREQNATRHAKEKEAARAAKAVERCNKKREKKREMVEELLRRRIDENLAEYVRVQHATDAVDPKAVQRKESLEKILDRLHVDLDRVAGSAAEYESRAQMAARRVGMYVPQKGHQDGSQNRKAEPFVPAPWPPL